LIAETLALAHPDLSKQGVVVHADAAPLPKVMGNRVQLQQVLLNLITNAVDAMTSADSPGVLRLKAERSEDGGVKVSVADTGIGIGPDDADRIFNPLYTTKSGGMGMGLSICRAIIESHEGRLWFSPNQPRGAMFQFTLPVA
jgi:signal transduction histidine kinase